MSAPFEELLAMSRQQDEPQRLLFLFANAEPQGSPNDEGQANGNIKPVMCVDKLPEALINYDALIDEADQITDDWNMVFISGLSGQNGQAPSEQDAEPFLNKMTNDLASGQDLSRYLVLDRNQQAIELERA